MVDVADLLHTHEGQVKATNRPSGSVVGTGQPLILTTAQRGMSGGGTNSQPDRTCRERGKGELPQCLHSARRLADWESGAAVEGRALHGMGSASCTQHSACRAVSLLALTRTKWEDNKDCRDRWPQPGL